MTLPPVIRIFFAVDLPLATKEKIGSFIGALKRKSRSHAIRWTRPENLHITLQFLAEVKTEHVTPLIEKVRLEIENVIQHADLNIGTVHLFPNPYRPRVIVLEIEPQAALAELAGAIGRGIQVLNYPVETRPFRGHLTLGRIKQPQGLDLHFLNEVERPVIEKIPVSEVVLFRSEPQPEGSQYTVLERIPFTKLNKPQAVGG